MARTFTPTQRSTASAAHVWHLSRCEVLDVDDTWQNLSDLGPDGVDTYLGGTVSRSLDANVWQATIRVRLSYGEASLSPLMFASLFNRDVADVYAPLLNSGVRVRLWARTMLPTDVEGDIDEQMIFDGRIDRPTFTADPMTLTCRDLGGKLIDTIIRRKVTYGDKDNPVAASAVIQQILTDAADLLGESITIVVPDEPTFVITERTIENISVMDAIQGVATLFGWVVAYRFQDDGSFALTLYDPQRDKDDPDYTLEPDEYSTVDEAAIDSTNVRNVIVVWYVDAVTGEASSTEPVKDTGSIAVFGEKYMQLGGDAVAAITNGNDALTLAQFALADLSTPLFDHTVTNTFTWFAEIGDYVGFGGNNVHYDEDQALGLVSITHEFPDAGQGAATTSFQCRGKPAGAYERWLRLQGGPVFPEFPPSPILEFLVAERTQYGGTTDTVDGGVWPGYRMPAGVDEIRFYALLGDGPNLGVPNPEPSTYAVTIRRPDGDIGKTPEYASIALLSTRPDMYKRIRMEGVRGGLTSKPVIAPSGDAIRASDPTPMVVEGTIAALAVTREGATNTVTVTPGTLEPTLGNNFVCIVRNKEILPPIAIGTSTTPVVFVDSGLEPSASATYAYEAFIANIGETWCVTGGKRITIAGTPALVAPEFALGTPLAANVAGQAKVQISWTGATPGASVVRVQASLDQIAVRSVGTGPLASGTLYDIPGVKSYRLVAETVLGEQLAFSPWAVFTAPGGPVSNPGAIPQFANGTPKPVLAGTSFSNFRILLSVQWTTQTPSAQFIAVQRSTVDGTGPFTTVPNGVSASVAAGEWRSPDSTYAGTDGWYRLLALAADGTTVLATSAVIHYVAPT